MNKGIYPALSGGVAYEKLLSIIANNVANINTAGYKADRPVFKVDVPDNINVTTLPYPVSDKFYTEIDSVFTDFNTGVIRQMGPVIRGVVTLFLMHQMHLLLLMDTWSWVKEDLLFWKKAG